MNLDRPECCQNHLNAVSVAEHRLTEAERLRLACPAEIEDADYLDLMKLVRLEREHLNEHERWHRTEAKRLAKLVRESEANTVSSLRLVALEDRAFSQALAEGLRIVAHRNDPEPPLIDDADRIRGQVIAACIYDHWAGHHEWPTKDDTAAAVAALMGTTIAAARRAVADNVQGDDYCAAQTTVLANLSEATPQGEADVWRLMVDERHWPCHDRRRRREQVGAEYDAVRDRWVHELLQVTPDS